MILLPRELPDLRTRMAEFCASRRGSVMHEFHLAEDPREPTQGDKVIAAAAAALDAASFQDALLYHVNRDMVDLLMQAKDGIGETGFMDYDLPTPVGVAYLDADLPTERPIWGDAPRVLQDLVEVPELPPDASPETRKEHAELTELVTKLGSTRQELARFAELDANARWTERLLILWRWMPPEPPEYPNGWVRVAWYEDRDTFQAKLDALEKLTEGEPIKHRDRITDTNVGRFVFDGHQVIACHPDASEMRVERYDGDDTWRARRGDMFRALCFLLRQRVAETETVMPDRAAQRRARREGKEPPPIRVISIRGAAVTSGAGDGQREWKHRWIVRGHWRRQWYRSIQAHRPVWIHPFVKGPEDAPLLGGEKVYSVRP